MSKSSGESSGDANDCNGEDENDDGEDDLSKAGVISARGSIGDEEILKSRVSSVRVEEAPIVAVQGVCGLAGVGKGIEEKAGDEESFIVADGRVRGLTSRGISDRKQEGASGLISDGGHSLRRRDDLIQSINPCPAEGKLDNFQGWNMYPSTTLYVNNIPPLSTTSKLKVWFGYFGSIVDVFIPRKRSKVGGLRFAFVRFWHEADALLACEKVDGSVFDGFVLEVNISRYPRMFQQHRLIHSLGKIADGGSEAPLSGNKSWAELNPGFRPVLRPAGMIEVNKSVVSSRVEAGASFAQFLKFGGNSKGVIKDESLRTTVQPSSYAQALISGNVSRLYTAGSNQLLNSADVEDKVGHVEENADHLFAVFCKNSGSNAFEGQADSRRVSSFLSEDEFRGYSLANDIHVLWSGNSSVLTAAETSGRASGSCLSNGDDFQPVIPSGRADAKILRAVDSNVSSAVQVLGKIMGADCASMVRLTTGEDDSDRGSGHVRVTSEEGIIKCTVSGDMPGTLEDGQEVPTGVKVSNLDMFNALMDKANGEGRGSVSSQVVAKKKFVLTQEFINRSIRKIRDVLDECRVLGISISARDQRAILKSMTKKHIQDEIDFYAELK